MVSVTTSYPFPPAHHDEGITHPMAVSTQVVSSSSVPGHPDISPITSDLPSNQQQQRSLPSFPPSANTLNAGASSDYSNIPKEPPAEAPTLDPAPKNKSGVTVKVTHRVSHVMFEVSEVGPVASTLPAPTLAMKPTHPIPSALTQTESKDSSKTKETPVFIPRITLDGRPLPAKSKFLPDAVAKRFMRKEPEVSLHDNGSIIPKVISSYSSTAVGSVKSSEASTEVHVSEKNPKLNSASKFDVSPKSTDNSNSGLLKEKSTERVYDIDSLLPSTTSENPSPPDVPSKSPVNDSLITENRPVESSPAPKISNTPSEDVLVIVETTSEPLKNVDIDDILLDHEKTFKREAVDKSLNVLKNKDMTSLFEDYEKEDVSVFTDDLASRDPRIYVNSEEESSSLEKKKVSNKKEKESFSSVKSTSITPIEFKVVTEVVPVFKNGTYLEKPVIKAKIIPSAKITSDSKDIFLPTEASTELPELEDILEKDEISPPFILKPELDISKLANHRFPSVEKEHEVSHFAERELEFPSPFTEADSSSNESESQYQGGLPTAAAVAEAAILSDFEGSKPRTSR